MQEDSLAGLMDGVDVDQDLSLVDDGSVSPMRP